MKRFLQFIAIASCFCPLKAIAQAPNLPTKGTLGQTIVSSRAFSNSTQVDTAVKYPGTLNAYTLEIVGKVNSATGRGLDIDARNAKGTGFRLSLDATNLKQSSSLNAISNLTSSKAGTDQIIRIAVRNDSAHIYQNGAYIQSQPLAVINDIVGGTESSVIQGTAPGPNLAPGWAGTSAAGFTGKPSDYGWAYNGTAVSTLFNTANSTSGSRYIDVNATSNTHTYNGTTYNGRTLYIRWDDNSYSNAVYTYPVTLEANTTYDFSMLYAYVSNATGSKSLTVGIGTSTDVSGRYASHTFTPAGTRDLKRESFVFTSQAAGTYYLTFTGSWGLYSIAELSCNKYSAGSLLPNWAGIAPINSGYPSDYSWAYTGATTTTLFNTANGGSGVRYLDVNASSGSNVHTYNGSPYVGRLLYIRWDGSPVQNTVYSYPMVLEANTVYTFSMLHDYISNATAGKTITVGIGTTTAIAGRIASRVFSNSGTRALVQESFTFTSQNAGLYYLTVNGDWALFAIGDLSLTKTAIKPRFIFGKNYPAGAVDMNITSVTYDNGAYAPSGIQTQARQDVTVTGATASFLPTFNTNFIVPGKTDMHLTGAPSPLINSTVQLNANDSWLFFDNVKPSVVTANWLSAITINGVPAVNNPSLRVSVYGNGTVLIPNGNLTSGQALQVYTGTNLSGSTTSYAINTYQDSLGSFNNAIRSFTLKRGYMATFANNPDGSGYSRVFIANDADLVVNTMPAGLDATVSFIRVFKWDWVSKKGKAGWSPDQVGATWYYDWNIGGGPGTNYNYAIIRQNGGWPSWTDIHNKQNVNHLLGFNEPDQTNQSNLTVEQAAQQWPEMMKSGLRIGSPAPANPESSWITKFLAKTDSLNLRVDFVAIHCYWGNTTPQNWYNRLKAIHDRVKRPLWITEWNNGANWTGESWPSDTTQALQKQLNDLKGILTVLDTASFVERYAEYDWVEYKRSLVLADTLTPAGKYYYANKSALAYNAALAPVHNWQLAAPQIYSSINTDNYFRATLSWLDLNGELGSKYVLERKINGVDADFTTLQEVTGYANGKTMTYVDSVYTKASYRIKAYNLAGTQFVYGAVLDVGKDASPVAPTTLTGTVLSSTTTTLAWNTNTTARSYNLKRAANAAGPFTTLMARTTSLQYRDTTLNPGTDYYYVVTSLNSAGESPNSTVLQLRTKDLTTPAAVVNPHVASGDQKITLTWDFIYDARYEISRSETANGTYTVIATNINDLRYEDLNKANGTTYYYKIVAFNAAGRSPATAVLQGTPVLGQYLHIAFNENTGTFTEDTWGGYNGTITNAATWTAGKDGPAGALNLVKANSAYVQLPKGVVSRLNDFTVAAWVKLPATLANNTRIFDFGTGTNNFMIFIPMSGGTNVRYKITGATGTNDRIIPYVLPLTQWVHITISQQGKTFKFYVNGAIQYSDTASTVKPSDLGVTTNNFLGKSQYGTDPYSDHIYDDFRIYNYALTDQGVAALAGGTATAQTQTINFNTLSAKAIGSADFDAGATTNSGLAVSYSSSDTTVATIVNAKIHLVGLGTTVIIATQAGDNTWLPARASQTLSVTDQTPPVVITSDVTLSLDASGNAVLTAAQVNNGSSDNIGITGLSIDKAGFTCANIGPNTVTLTATDANGNTSSATATVTVKDVTAPVAPVLADVTGQCSATATVPTATDNCAGVVRGTTADALTYTAQGSYVIHWSFSDGNGNTSTAEQNVIIKDDVAPTVLTKNISVSLVNGAASITADQVNNGSYDNCSGIKTMSVSPASFTCGQYGANTVTLTATDNNGNTATQTATVNVVGLAPAPYITISRTDNTYTGLPDNTIALGYGAQSVILGANNSTSAPEASNYAWSPATGLSNTTIANPVFTPTAAGTYTFNVTVTNEFGCTTTTPVTIIVTDVRCGNKVVVCHKTGSSSNELCINANAVNAHLKHGDKLGPCNAVATYAAGASSNAYAASINSNEVAEIPAAKLLAYPNPFGKKTTVSFSLPKTEDMVSVEVFSLYGARVATLYTGKIEGGKTNSFLFDGTKLAAGTYMVRLTTSAGVQSFRIIMAE
ncbi:T9SS type A sorting domain-containing protein [Mucilaginibacter sp. HMF5004]|uniref:glycosyl hydrolase n=1 Tax=Mucilaginibacter rivuli TaxID=2857527 RepID=UPI001C5E9677|nr:glycosyl hydrolase [Mucilaginibacter rivuli]MBW4889757.1 T9SS type A sorting domain-containing protein [Mucilaginibacter rivuli]